MSSPFLNEAANVGYQEALSISEKAAEEFKRVIQTLGDNVDVDDVRIKIRDKYSKNSASHSSGIILNEPVPSEAADNPDTNKQQVSKPELSSKDRMVQLQKELSTLKQGID